MAINKKLIHFSKQENFDKEVANDNILDTSICFIKDSKSISTHGTIYPTVNWSILDPTNGYDYVDLGLPSGLKWATCNVGASSPEDYGDYFAWGETETKTEYTQDNSLTDGLTISELQSQGYIDGSGNLTPSHDAATANWGGSWRMPTEDEMRELADYCEWEWTVVNGINGVKFIGLNGNHIFLPAAGIFVNNRVSGQGTGGIYHSSTSYTSSDGSYRLSYDKEEVRIDNNARYVGYPIRPVINI